MQSPPKNVYADVSSGTCKLNFWSESSSKSIFEYGSSKSGHLRRLREELVFHKCSLLFVCLDLNIQQFFSGHVERSSGAVRTACDIQIDGRRGSREAQANMEETDRERLP